MIDCLVTRATGRALALAQLVAEMRLEGGTTHCVTIRPALPSTDKKFLLKLLQLEIGAHPPQAAMVALTLRAEAGRQSKVQLGLFAPQTPEPSRLDVTLARLRALVGEERVGSPVLDDTHRAGGFRLEGLLDPRSEKRGTGGTREAPAQSLVPIPPKRSLDGAPRRMALRRVRPARAVRVALLPTLAANNAARMGHPMTKPVAFSDGESRYEIAAAYGPWRTSGCWWTLEAWDTEEWDVLAVRAEKHPSGAKAPTHLGADTARLKSCPDTSWSRGLTAGGLEAASTAGLETGATGVGERERWTTVSTCAGQETGATSGNAGAAVACLLVHDRARNVWRLEAFYD